MGGGGFFKKYFLIRKAFGAFSDVAFPQTSYQNDSYDELSSNIRSFLLFFPFLFKFADQNGNFSTRYYIKLSDSGGNLIIFLIVPLIDLSCGSSTTHADNADAGKKLLSQFKSNKR